MSFKKPVNLSNFSENKLVEWMDSFDVIFCDCDGVLWSHDTLFNFANETINKFVSLGKRVYLVTNNSQTTREEMFEKCKQMNFNLKIENLMTCSYVTAQYLKQQGFNKKAFVCGPEALGTYLTEAGIEHFGIGPDHLEHTIVDYATKHYELEEGVGAIVIGFDAQFSYKNLLKAVNYLKDSNVEFIATNADPCFKFPWFTLPEVGPLVLAIEFASGRKATIMGKPSLETFKVIAAESEPINLERTLMIGDRAEVDIVFGKNCGMKTLLVGTGMTSFREIEEIMKKLEKKFDGEIAKVVPDFVIPRLGDIAWKSLKGKFK